MSEQPVTEYCRNCGHPKEHHDMNLHVDAKHARRTYEDCGESACHDMSGDHHCICVSYETWH